MDNKIKTEVLIERLRICADTEGCLVCKYLDDGYCRFPEIMQEAADRLEKLNYPVATAGKNHSSEPAKKMGDTAHAIMQRAIDTYGERAQCDVAIEEMAELTKALLKTRRAPDNDHAAQQRAISNVVEEIADVEIMISQLKIIYGAHYVDAVREWKLVRLENRMEGKL